MRPRVNRIRARHLLPLLEHYVRVLDSDTRQGWDAGVAVLAERAGVEFDTLYRILRGRNATVDFDMAERVLNAMGLLPHALHAEPLHTDYMEVRFS